MCVFVGFCLLPSLFWCGGAQHKENERNCVHFFFIIATHRNKIIYTHKYIENCKQPGQQHQQQNEKQSEEKSETLLHTTRKGIKQQHYISAAVRFKVLDFITKLIYFFLCFSAISSSLVFFFPVFRFLVVSISFNASPAEIKLHTWILV